jgi:hypothetical protein
MGATEKETPMRFAKFSLLTLLVGGALGGCGDLDDPSFEGASAALRLDTAEATPRFGNVNLPQARGFTCWGFVCLNRSGLNLPEAFDIPARGRLREVNIWSGDFIDGIELLWQDLNNPQNLIRSPHRGGFGGDLVTLSLDPDEAIIGVELRTGKYVDYLRLITSKQDKHWGGEGGSPRTINLRPGAEIHGIGGLSGNYIDAIGFWSYLP